MAGAARRTVFTGMGVLSAIGADPNTLFDSLVQRQCGIRRIVSSDPTALPCQLAAELPDFKPKNFITNRDHLKSFKVMARTVQMGFIASHLAFQHAKAEVGKIDPTRAGVEYGAGMIASELDDLGRAARLSLPETGGPVSYKLWGEKGIREVPPLWMLKYLPNMPSCHVSITLDLRGPSNTITQTDAASLLALGEAFRIIQRDVADFFVVGGTESKLNPLSLARHNLFQQLSRRNDDPAHAVRPFDRDRDGCVLGEAAGSVILEEFTHAQQRGATIYGELMSVTTGFDRARDGAVLAHVIRKALQYAGATPEQVDHVNAQGLATAVADPWEARAIHEVFGPKVPVWAMKPNIGNSGAASSVTELIGSIVALQRGQLPPTLNHDHPDSACPIHVHTDGLRPVTKPYAVKLAFTDLGQVGVAVIKKWEG